MMMMMMSMKKLSSLSMLSLHSSASPSSINSSLYDSSHFLSNSKNFISVKRRSDVNPPANLKLSRFSVACASREIHYATHDSSFQGSESFFRSVLASVEAVYLYRNPTATAILELVRSVDGDRICYDHFAFRTFGVGDHGIDSVAKFFLDFGYSQREELRFPAKKLKAFWFSPPMIQHSDEGTGVNGPLPRIFISELLVDQMSPEAQEIIRKYSGNSTPGNKYAATASALGTLTWEKPSCAEFKLLARESEYAAWTLVNGYALNHITISTHRLKSHLRNIKSLNQFIEEKGFKLNSEGGALKVSPDGLLLQSSTVADSVPFQFSDGVTELVPSSYIEFAQRLVLPQYKDLPEKQVKEFHRRDGFEVGNADKIFESTYTNQLARGLVRN